MRLAFLLSPHLMSSVTTATAGRSEPAKPYLFDCSLGADRLK